MAEMKPLALITALFPALLAASTVVAAKDPPQITAAGQYSSLVRTESEDDVGMRVVIGYSNRGWYAILQCAGGNLDRPVVVTVQVDEDKRTSGSRATTIPTTNARRKPSPADTGPTTSNWRSLAVTTPAS
ncbi:hypothetical protein [Thermomonas sp.]|uniref:hypothetical protein n=1 Tax=Thermomonas sp. TaxID=1971895 RepID=UPI00261F4165|nr:hypothetical protein [Thermomonas sp.]MCO5055283.1 hypothetical protein [Thermomonas sp.]